MIWVSIKNKLPEVDRRVLFLIGKSGTISDKGDMHVGYRDEERNPWMWTTGHSVFTQEEVSHWMVLPEEP